MFLVFFQGVRSCGRLPRNGNFFNPRAPENEEKHFIREHPKTKETCLSESVSERTENIFTREHLERFFFREQPEHIFLSESIGNREQKRHPRALGTDHTCLVRCAPWARTRRCRQASAILECLCVCASQNARRSRLGPLCPHPREGQEKQTCHPNALGHCSTSGAWPAAPISQRAGGHDSWNPLGSAQDTHHGMSPIAQWYML